jgi:hypothetical protein
VCCESLFIAEPCCTGRGTTADRTVKITRKFGTTKAVQQRPSRTAAHQADEKVAALEWSLAAQRERMAGIEAAILNLEPERELPATNRKPNPIFEQGAMPRLPLAVLREAGGPMGQRRGWFSRDQGSVL